MYDKVLFQFIENNEYCLGFIILNKINFEYYLNSNKEYTLTSYLKLWIKIINNNIKKELNIFEINIIGNLKDNYSDENVKYNIIIDESKYYLFYLGEQIKEENENNINNNNNDNYENQKKINLFEKMIKIKNVKNYVTSNLYDNEEKIDLLKDLFAFDF